MLNHQKNTIMIQQMNAKWLIFCDLGGIPCLMEGRDFLTHILGLTQTFTLEKCCWR